jgi:hypothetical protein
MTDEMDRLSVNPTSRSAPTNPQPWGQPTRQRLLDEGRRQARIYGVNPACADVYAEGWAAAARHVIGQAGEPLRTVQIYGYGYQWRDPRDGSTKLLDPRDVTVILPSTRHLDDFDLHNSLHLTEQKLDQAGAWIAELERQRDAVLALCDEAEGSHNSSHWHVIDIDDVRAIYQPSTNTGDKP